MRQDQLIKIPRKQCSQDFSPEFSVSKRQPDVQRHAAVQNAGNFLYDIAGQVTLFTTIVLEEVS